MKRHIADHNCGANDEHFFTIDFSNEEIEAAIGRGGSGPTGFDATSFVGIEVIGQTTAELEESWTDHDEAKF